MFAQSNTVTVPASTANLGAGFDCLALALGLRNTVELSDLGHRQGLEFDVQGEGAEGVPRDASNLIARSAERVFQAVGRWPGGALRVRSVNRIPPGSGLGSSSAAIVGGMVAANALVGGGLGRADLLRLACDLEGHPDNVAAALYGGLVIVSASGEAPVARSVPVAPRRVVIALPDVRLSTAEARAALPQQVPLADAVFNLGHALFTVQALAAEDDALLAWAVDDRLHQPYRQRLVPGYAEVAAAARQAGAAAVALSGAGPSLVAFAARGHAEIAAAMQQAFGAHGLACRTFVLAVDPQGAIVG